MGLESLEDGKIKWRFTGFHSRGCKSQGRKAHFGSLQKESRELRNEEAVQKGGFGARTLYAGVIFPSKIRRIKNFRGGGFSGLAGQGGGGLRFNFGGHFVLSMCFFGTGALQKGSRELRNEVLPPPQCRPLRHSMRNEQRLMLQEVFIPEGSLESSCIKTFNSCYRTPGPQKGFRRGLRRGL